MTQEENLKNRFKLRGKKILVDTNILINCGRGEFGKYFKYILRLLSDQGNFLAVSSISGYEIIKKYNNKDVTGYYLDLLHYIANKPVTQNILNIAGIYSNKMNLSKSDHKKDNDSIIGSTVIKEKGTLFLTCNRSDFGKPYWVVKNRACVYWDDGDKCRVENVYLLEFDLDPWVAKYLKKPSPDIKKLFNI